MNEVVKTWYSSNLIYTYGEIESSSFNSSLYNRLNNVRISILSIYWRKDAQMMLPFKFFCFFTI